MISNAKKFSLFCLFTIFMFAATVTVAEEGFKHIDFDKETPSGTLEFEATAVKLLAGGTWGKGVLNYQGKAYPLKVKAATLGGIGYQKIEGEGEVYFLDKLEDFTGKYGSAAAGASAGKGKGVATLQKGNVVLQLRAKSKGVALAASLGGISIEFAD